MKDKCNALNMKRGSILWGRLVIACFAFPIQKQHLCKRPRLKSIIALPQCKQTGFPLSWVRFEIVKHKHEVRGVNCEHWCVKCEDWNATLYKQHAAYPVSQESHLRSLKIALQPFFVLLFDLCFVVGHDLHRLWITPMQYAEKFSLNCSSSAPHRY